MADADDERGVPIPMAAAPPNPPTAPTSQDALGVALAQALFAPKTKAKKRKLKRKKVKKMVDTVMMPDNSGGAGLGLGAGLGGGFLGGILGGLLFNRGGLLGNGVNGVDGGLVGGNGATNTILQTLGAIQGAIPLAESQVQVALATQTASITNQLNTNTNLIQTQVAGANVANLQGQAQLERALSQQSQGLERALNAQSQLLQSAVAGVSTQADRNLFQISQAITADGAQTRALIVAQNDATLNRIIVNQAAELAELRNEGARANDRHGIEINMINNQNQNQLQFQQQQQQLGTVINGLATALQSIHATNQAINIGAGTQTANPTNTNTNVRA